MIFIPCKVVLVVDILDDEVGGDKGDGDDDIMAMRMMGVIWVMMMMMILMVSPCKVVLVVDILDDEVCVHSSLLLLPDDLVATSLENGFSMFFFLSFAFFNIKGLHSLCLTLYYSSVVLSRPCCDWTWMGLLFADMTKM